MPKCKFNKVAKFSKVVLLNFIEITFRHGCSPVNSLHIFWTTFPKNTFGRLLLNLCYILLNKPNKWCERSEACWNSNNLPFWLLFHSCKKLHYPNFHYNMLKLVSAIFINFLFFHQIALQKLWKMFFLSSKSSFRSRDIQFFVFLPVGHCFRGWSKINLNVHDVINCLNKNSITHFVWYLGRKKGMTMKPCQ